MTTVDDILAVLASMGHKPDPEAQTMAELMAAWGKSDKWCRSAIKALSAQGYVQVVKKLVGTISGGTSAVPAYVVSVPGDRAASASTQKRRVPNESQKGSSNGPRNSRRQRRK